MRFEGPVDDALQVLLGRPEGAPPLAALRLRPTRADEIRATTAGEIVRTQTLSFDTLVPHDGGLFCERIFGSMGIEVEGREARARALESPFLRAREDDVLAPRPRMERFARITLTTPIEHPLLAREGWRATLEAAGLDSWFIEALPVLPPDLRAIVPVPQTDGTLRFAVSDLNDLYRVVVTANARRARLRELHAPKSLLDVEDARLEEAIVQLVDNASTGEPRLGPSGRPLIGLLGVLSHPSRPTWTTLAELDGMVARGVVRMLAPPLAKRSFAVLAYLRALGITLEVARPGELEVATVH